MSVLGTYEQFYASIPREHRYRGAEFREVFYGDWSGEPMESNDRRIEAKIETVPGTHVIQAGIPAAYISNSGGGGGGFRTMVWTDEGIPERCRGLKYQEYHFENARCWYRSYPTGDIFRITDEDMRDIKPRWSLVETTTAAIMPARCLSCDNEHVAGAFDEVGRCHERRARLEENLRILWWERKIANV